MGIVRDFHPIPFSSVKAEPYAETKIVYSLFILKRNRNSYQHSPTSTDTNKNKRDKKIKISILDYFKSIEAINVNPCLKNLLVLLYS